MYMSMKENDEDECVICFEEIDTSKKYVQCCSCMKKYHYKCICNWNKKAQEKRVCPTCQQRELLVYSYKKKLFSDCLPFLYDNPIYLKIKEFEN